MQLSAYTCVSGRSTVKASVILKISLFLLVAVHLYSYANSDWQIVENEWNHILYASKFAAIDKQILFPRYLVLSGIFLISAFYSFRRQIGAVYSFLFCGLCFIHAFWAFSDLGIATGLYSSNIPLNYLLLLGFWVGMEESVFDTVKTAFFPLALLYAAAFIAEFVDSYSRFGWVIYQNSSLMSYFSNMFWLAAAAVYVRVSEKKTIGWGYLFPLFLFIAAFILRSRSWIIQSVLFLLLTAAEAGKNRKTEKGSRPIRSILIAVVLMAVAVFILTRYFDAFVESVLNKGTTDSRTFQYEEMFAQTPRYKWIFGQGMTATYTSALYGEYAFIDNETLYLSFHYGVIFAVLYFAPYIGALFKAIKARKELPAFLFGFGMMVLWLCSINGLSVYNRILLDTKSFLMPLLAGRLYYTAKEALRKKGDC